MKAPNGNIVIGFYDEDGTAAIKKVVCSALVVCRPLAHSYPSYIFQSLRYGEDISATPLFSVDMDHKVGVLLMGWLVIITPLLSPPPLPLLSHPLSSLSPPPLPKCSDFDACWLDGTSLCCTSGCHASLVACLHYQGKTAGVNSYPNLLHIAVSGLLNLNL